MMSNQSPRWHIRHLCGAICLIALFLGTALNPLTWVLLAVREFPFMAVVRFGIFWIGLLWVVLFAKTSSSRFFGLAVTPIVMQLVLVPLPRWDVAVVPDIPSTFNKCSMLAAGAFWIIGLALRVTPVSRPPRTPGNPGHASS